MQVGRGLGQRGHAENRLTALPRPPPAGPARRRRRPHLPWLTQRPAPAPRVARVRASAWSPARETRPPRPDRHVPAPDPLIAPAPRRRPRVVPRPPGLGATHGGRDRCPDLSRRPTLGAPAAFREPAQTGMSPIGRVDAESAP